MSMGLDDEIMIYQFGQGVYSDTAMMDHFNELDDDEKRKRYFDLYFLGRQLKPEESDIGQAIANSSLGDAYRPNIVLNKLWSKAIRVNTPAGDIQKDYLFMLHLFKIAYQRRLNAEKENPSNWRYWNLSTSGIAQDIVASYRALVEQVYTNPSFRSEFASLAKLVYERKTIAWAKPVSSDTEHENKFDFFTYDEIVTASINRSDNKYSYAISLLKESLSKALLKQYGLDIEQVNRVELDVIDRHMREAYNTGIFDR